MNIHLTTLVSDSESWSIPLDLMLLLLGLLWFEHAFSSNSSV